MCLHGIGRDTCFVYPIIMHTLEQLRAGQLAGITRLTLSQGLRTFPEEIFSLADTLEILDLSGNELASLPDDLPRLHKLRVLFCSDNAFTRLPEVLGRCEQLEMIGFKSNRIQEVPGASLPSMLRWLILTNNNLESVPDELGRCARLQKLMLAGNRLSSLPQALGNCSRLELLRIAANQLEAFPEWIGSLPRLSWLAYAGNPCCQQRERVLLNDSPIRTIAWQELELQQQLGAGASGVIHRAVWQGQEGVREVAVKMFKGDVTSDGFPLSEMAGCIAAGSHPNLIGVLGKLSGHPEEKAGLVMELVPAHYHVLADPPSLASCTRDVYREGQELLPAQVVRMALGVAEVAQHLHANGLMHGDLYAHNILHDENGHALLGDFGAASSIPGNWQRETLALQRIEVRAYGCLLEELLTQCDWTGSALRPLHDRLATLQLRCVSDIPAERPPFAEVVRELRGISLSF